MLAFRQVNCILQVSFRILNLPALFKFSYNFTELIARVAVAAGKLLLVCMWMCSFNSAFAQLNTDSLDISKQSKLDTPVTNLISNPDFDPLDTVVLRPSKSAMKDLVNYTARDSMPYDAITKTVYLYGDATVTFEDLKLEADLIIIEFDKQLITARGTIDTTGELIGKPYFKQGGSDYRAKEIKYNYNSKKGYLSEFKTKEGEGYIHGDDVLKTPSNEFGIKDAKYTTCELDHPHYYIGATKIKVIPEKKIVTGAAELWIEDVPTPLLLPFGIFSLKRGQSSGIIIPSYGRTPQRGFFLNNGGYYFGLGEKADLSVTADVYANLSWATRAGYRYNNRYRYNGRLQLDLANLITGERGDPNYFKSRDFSIRWQHNQDPKARPFTNFSSNVNIVSVNTQGNSFLANNSFNPQNIITNQLQSSISYQKGFKNGKYNLSANARMDQNTQTRAVNLSLPDLTFVVPSFAPLKPRYKNTADKWYENIQTNYTVVFRNEVSTADSVLFRSINSGELLRLLDTASRFGLQHQSQIQTNFKVLKHYTLSIGTDLRELWYFQTIRKETDSEGRINNERVNGFERLFMYTPRAGISTRYYGMAQFKKGPVKAFRHVMTPTLDFSYSPDYTQSSFGGWRTYNTPDGSALPYSIFERGIFGGAPLQEQGNIGFSLDNNVEMKVAPSKKDTSNEARKIQIFESIFLRSAWNIFADSLNLQPISMRLQTRLAKNISLNGNMRIDPYLNQINTLPNNIKQVTRINEFYLNNNGSIGTITDGDIGLNANFNPKMFQRKNVKPKKGYEGEAKYINDNPLDYYDFDIPWTFNMNYTIRYNKYLNLNQQELSNFIQTFNFNGDVNVTQNWKVGFTSGYDIRNKQITFTSIDIVRQIHCWEFKLNWIPIGFRQSFLFTINVKSSLLQDLRMQRNRSWLDRNVNAP